METPINPATLARFHYLREESRVSSLMVFILNGTVLLARTAAASQSGLIDLHSALGYQNDWTLEQSEVDIDAHRPIIAEMLLCRAVDNFLTYIVELLALLYAERPEMLRSNEQIGVDLVLQHPEMDSLRRSIAERRIERLSYLGMRELVKHVKDQHGFDLGPDDSDLNRAVSLIEMRNLIVHNRGLVNRLSATKCPDLAAHLGKRIPLDYADIKGHRRFLAQEVLHIDIAAIEKFKLTSVLSIDAPAKQQESGRSPSLGPPAT